MLKISIALSDLTQAAVSPGFKRWAEKEIQARRLDILIQGLLDSGLVSNIKEGLELLDQESKSFSIDRLHLTLADFSGDTRPQQKAFRLVEQKVTGKERTANQPPWLNDILPGPPFLSSGGFLGLSWEFEPFF